jgi:hypothetical protein
METALAKTRPEPVPEVAAGTVDLTDRQVVILMAIGVVLLLMAILALGLYGGPGIVPASTSAADLTAATLAMTF